jgi:hypothetical protein
MALPQAAMSASSWSPALLVNTESFQTIDEGDSTTNLELRFGGTLNEKLIFNRTRGSFQFTDDLSVLGHMSGSSLNVDRNATVGGTLTATGSIRTRGNLSGASLNVNNTAKIGGVLAVSGSIAIEAGGSLTGSTIYGFGLAASCTGSNHLQYNSTTGRFECASDPGSSNETGTATFSGAVQSVGDSRYIKKQGDTMTGALTVNVQGGTLGSIGLRVVNTFSGAIVQATKQLRSSGSLAVEGDATVDGGTLAVDSSNNRVGVGTTAPKTTFEVQGAISGSTLRIGAGGADVQGALAVSGALRTDSDFSINDDRSAGDATLTFGNATTNQTLKYLATAQKFQFSKDVSVVGNLSGSTLTVDGAANVRGGLSASGSVRVDGNLSGSTLNVDGVFNWRGQAYTAPASQVANGVLKTDGAGNLTWSAVGIGSSSGASLSFHPEYPNAVYFASGSSTVGQLTATGGMAGMESVYRWVSTKGTMNDYWIGVRVRVPNNFLGWVNSSTVKPIQLRYRTGSGQSAAQTQGSYVTVKMLDTAGAPVALAGGANLANTAYTTASITGPESGGTYTKGGYINILLKLAASTTPNGTWFTEAGFLNLNWLTSAP